MKACIVLGTRPEIIKCASLLRHFRKTHTPCVLIHTGQHYAENLDAVFFDELQLPAPDHHLGIGSGTHGDQTSRMLKAIEEVLMTEKPDVVIVQGDTNTALAGALAAAKLHIPVGHLEAGLRSYNRKMPEEINRVLIDHCADLLFAPTEAAAEILRNEGIPGEKIIHSGNTVVDAVEQHLTLLIDAKHVLTRLHLEPKQYFLVTCHRPENVDGEEQLSNILASLHALGEEHGLPILYPIHPRTEKMIALYHLQVPETIRLMPPLGYGEFLHLQKHAALIITDSGGIQEEACILGVPCVTLRTTTERPETLEIGSNILADATPASVLSATAAMLGKQSGWKHPFGDGKAYLRIAQACIDTCSEAQIPAARKPSVAAVH